MIEGDEGSSAADCAPEPAGETDELDERLRRIEARLDSLELMQRRVQRIPLLEARV